MRLLRSLELLKCVCRLVAAFFMLALLVFPAAGEPGPPPISGSNGLMGLMPERGANSSAPPRIKGGANSSTPQTGSSGKPISDSADQQRTPTPGTATESSPPSADAQDAELESSPPSAPPNVAPSPSAQSNRPNNCTHRSACLAVWASCRMI